MLSSLFSASSVESNDDTILSDTGGGLPVDAGRGLKAVVAESRFRVLHCTQARPPLTGSTAPVR